MSTTRAEIKTYHYETVDDDFREVIATALENKWQFSGHHDGERWNVAIAIPPIATLEISASEPEVA